jgi:ABC-type bacteriocin/lantibiotic exporter with double-glycine peptidase domain
MPETRLSIRLLLALFVSASYAAFGESGSRNQCGLKLSEYDSCGAVCLKTLCSLHGISITMDQISKMAQPTKDGGISLAELCRVIRQLGINLVPVQCELNDLPERLPTVAYRKQNEHRGHYYVIARHENGRFLIIDPPRQSWWATTEQMQKAWSGNAAIPMSTESREPSIRLDRIILSILGGGGLGIIVYWSVCRLPLRHT